MANEKKKKYFVIEMNQIEMVQDTEARILEAVKKKKLDKVKKLLEDINSSVTKQKILDGKHGSHSLPAAQRPEVQGHCKHP